MISANILGLDQWRIQEMQGGGAPIFAKIYTHHRWHLYALDGPGHAPRKIFKSEASNDAF